MSIRSVQQSFQTLNIRRSSVISVTRDRSRRRITARSAKSSTKESTVEEYLLECVHRLRFCLSFERSVQKKSSKSISGGRETKISKERNP
jgi:hypothetical protein